MNVVVWDGENNKYVDLQADSSKNLKVVLQAAAVAIGKLAANSGVDIGDVDVTSIPDVDPVTATPTVYNVTLTSADTEYSQAMVANCRRFEFQCRTSADVRFSTTTGKVATPTAPWMTLKSGMTFDSGPINQGGSPSTLYFGSGSAGVIMEIISWS